MTAVFVLSGLYRIRYKFDYTAEMIIGDALEKPPENGIFYKKCGII